MKTTKPTKHEIIKNYIDEIQKNKPATEGFHYEYEYSSYYGGYILVMVNNESGWHRGCFGGNGCEPRVNYKTFLLKLQTIINS